MNGALFALVCAQDHGQVLAWGMEITLAEDPEAGTATRSAVVYRPALGEARDMISTHSSAEAACAAYGRIAAVDLEWEADRCSPAKPSHAWRWVACPRTRS